jgi:hypothetical protein
MKEMNLLETQLRSWQPRRPSARLKRRLFAAPARVMPQMAWFLGWLAPATACALLTLSVFNSGNSLPGSPSRHEPMVAMMLSNQSYAAYVSSAFQSGQNDLPSVVLDWTNRSGSTSSMPSFLRGGMN